MPSKDHTPSDDTTNIYARCYAALSPIIARTRRYQPPSTGRPDETEWLVWNIPNLGNRKLGRGDCILLADIAGPPPSYDSQGSPHYPEVRLLMAQPYEMGHYCEKSWRAYLTEDTSTRAISTVHFPKHYITPDDTPQEEARSPTEHKLTSHDAESIAEEITRHRTQRTQNTMEITCRITSETHTDSRKH
ncbi:hypothetical protein H0H92_002963 [Tricholoma furcatifolium]|nr:hypothetical protein H0H92_002963 [Tricholoma furcatifolium]